MTRRANSTVHVALNKLLLAIALVLFTIANMGYTILWLYFERPECKCCEGKEGTGVVFKAPVKKVK